MQMVAHTDENGNLETKLDQQWADSVNITKVDSF